MDENILEWLLEDETQEVRLRILKERMKDLRFDIIKKKAIVIEMQMLVFGLPAWILN